MGKYSNTVPDLCNRWWQVVSITLLPLYPRKIAFGMYRITG
jgi:hypothetical protein